MSFSVRKVTWGVFFGKNCAVKFCDEEKLMRRRSFVEENLFVEVFLENSVQQVFYNKSACRFF